MAIRLLKRRGCRCDPQWPSLVTEQHGYSMPAIPAEHGSPWTRMNDLRARCEGCGATYPGNFVIAPGTPPPFAWAREPKNPVCTCDPQWPELMAKVDGYWWYGRSGADGEADGEHVVDGDACDAFCRSCGAYHLGPMVLVTDEPHPVPGTG